MKIIIGVAFSCLIALASAQGNMWGGMMPNNNMNMNNMNMLQQLMMQGMNNYHQMMPQNPGMMWGQQQRPQQHHQQGMSNNVVGSLLGNMLGTVLIQGLRGQMAPQEGGNMGQDELSRLEEMAKMSMATEMFDLMRAYNKYKDDEEEFIKAMHSLCLMVNATYVASKQYNFPIFNVTTDETPYQVEQETMMMSEEDKLQYVINKMINEQKLYEEMFFRMAAWSCWSGQNYVNSAMAMQKLERQGSCERD